jgi:hypothetical protein
MSADRGNCEARDARFLADFSEGESAALEFDWQSWGRPEQLLPDGDWLTWLLLSGRDFGKMLAGSQARLRRTHRWQRGSINKYPRRRPRCPVEGPAGLVRVHPEPFRPF